MLSSHMRYTHAARASSLDGESSQAGSSRMGEYRFPTKGRNGGPPDPYEVLGLGRGADEGEVKRRYYTLARLIHPDSSHPSSSTEHFATLHRAYTLLSNPSTRNIYLQTGYGWSHSSHQPTESWSDAQMRAEIRRRKHAGTAAWGHHQHRHQHQHYPHGGHYHEWDGGWYTPERGEGEERFMSNGKFLALTAGVSVILAWLQYHRFGAIAETHSQLSRQQHTDASQALAEARRDAALYGKERREQIRRRVRESEVIKEVEESSLKSSSSPSISTNLPSSSER
ncbi:hypothetical protein M231_05122 [Tremella mesenterica]|uniref:J domain-containing protein n=1 Tax=Tremella mesenterica TaxID=5217 RepID=A0A4Q1BIW7_TREME|nr:hypothetical protein M231_05122 [Tremella mesenterica]